MQHKLDTISDHYIVCGYGRMGNQICDALTENQVKFVVVENEPHKIEVLQKSSLYLLKEMQPQMKVC